MKEKKTRHKVRYGYKLWMFPEQAKDVSEGDLDKALDNLFDKITEEKKDL